MKQMQWCGLEQAANIGATCGHTCSYRHPGYGHILSGCWVLPWRTAAEASAVQGGVLGACRYTAGGASPERRRGQGVSLAVLGGNLCLRSRRGQLACKCTCQLPRARRTHRGRGSCWSWIYLWGKASKICRGPWPLCWPLVPSSVVGTAGFLCRGVPCARRSFCCMAAIGSPCFSFRVPLGLYRSQLCGTG